MRLFNKAILQPTRQSIFFPLKKDLTWQACFEKDFYGRVVVGKSLDQSRIDHQQRLQSRLFIQYMAAKRIKLLVGGLSGTFTDPFSMAPASAFVKTFKQFGVSIYPPDVRKDMGLPKERHIEALLGYPEVRHAFERDLKRSPDVENDVPVIYKIFLAKQMQALNDYNFLLPGVKNISEDLKRRDTLIGLSTGFSRKIVDRLLPGMAKQLFKPDFSVASDDIKHGQRPYPHMIYKNMEYAGVHNSAEVIKLGDTPSDCAEGISAHTWIVGTYGFGNGVGINSLEEYYDLVTQNPEKLKLKRHKAEKELIESGAHYVISSPLNLLAVFNDIHERLSDNQTPDMCLGLAREQSLKPGFRRGS